MSITDQYNAAASQAQSATEQIMDAFQVGTRSFKEQISVLSELQSIDAAPAKSYFQIVQQTVDASREFTLQWIQAMNYVTSIIREQAKSVGALLGQ